MRYFFCGPSQAVHDANVENRDVRKLPSIYRSVIGMALSSYCPLQPLTVSGRVGKKNVMTPAIFLNGFLDWVRRLSSSFASHVQQKGTPLWLLLSGPKN